MKQWKILIFCVAAALLLGASSVALAYVPIDKAHFPDAAFRAYVSEAFETDDEDGILSDGEAGKVTQIDVSGKHISDLTGIEFFPALISLNCGDNQLTSLDVGGCSALQRLSCGDNQLTSLDVSGCSALESLHCDSNQLTALDVNQNLTLEYLNCSSNQLTALDVSQNPKLRTLSAFGNSLEITAEGGSFDLSALPGFDMGKASGWTGGTVAGTILTVPRSGDVTYSYDCGKGYSETFTLNVTVTGGETPAIQPGDVTGDGALDGRDALRLLKYLAGQDVAMEETAADVNGDGVVDGRDALRLLKQLAAQ